MDHTYYNKPSNLHVQSGGDYPEKIDFFLRNLRDLTYQDKTPAKILDIACHNGKLSSLYGEFGDIYGIDINEKAVKEAQKKGIRAVHGDVMVLDKHFKKNHFDIVIAGDIIEHLFDTDAFLNQIYDVLRPAGTLLLSTPNIVSLGRRLMGLMGKNPYTEYSAKEDGINVGHIRYYTYDDLYNQLKENSFKNVVIETDTANIPVKLVDRLLIHLRPKLGRELYAKASK